jgi:pyridoxine/pyridoxamine 5'-phosphate oxidase
MSDKDKSLVLSYFNTISGRGWTVDSNLSTVATANEDGEIVESTMICAKVDESYNDYYTHLDSNGNKVILRTAKMVMGPRENEWTVFASLEDAEQHFGLTRVD